MTIFFLLIKENKKEFFALVFLTCIITLVESILHPLMLKWLFDEAILRKNFTIFIYLSIAYLIIGLFVVITTYFINLWNKSFENKILSKLETDLLSRSLGLDFRKFSTQGSSYYLSRIHKDSLEGMIPSIRAILQISKSTVASIAFTGILFYLSWEASAVLILIFPILLFASNFVSKSIKESTETERESEGRYINLLSSTLEAFRSLRGMPRLLAPTRNINKETLNQYLGVTYTNYALITRQKTLSDVFMVFSDTTAMAIGAYFVFLGRLSFGGFLAFTNALWRAVDSVFSVLRLIPELQRYSAILGRINQLYSEEFRPYIASSPIIGMHNITLTFNEIEVVKISQFEIHKGERVLIKGSNGSGKTSLLHMLSGYLSPDSGKIFRPDSVASLTAPVKLPPLKVGTLVTNYLLLERLNLKDLHEQLPENLSSGQRQKLGIALLLSENAEFYIIDEPTANLDIESKDLVLNLIFECLKDKTIIIVDHIDSRFDHQFSKVFVQGKNKDLTENLHNN